MYFYYLTFDLALAHEFKGQYYRNGGEPGNEAILLHGLVEAS